MKMNINKNRRKSPKISNISNTHNKTNKLSCTQQITKANTKPNSYNSKINKINHKIKTTKPTIINNNNNKTNSSKIFITKTLKIPPTLTTKLQLQKTIASIY